MVLLAAWCAMRFGELAELRRHNLDLDRVAEIKRLKKENADLREANEILKAASTFSRRTRPSAPLLARSDERTAGHGVESICLVLREQGLTVAPRTYRS